MDFDSFFEKNRDFYLGFQERVNRDLPKTAYARDFNRKMSYYSGVDQQRGGFWKYLSAFLAALLALVSLMWWKAKNTVVHVPAIAEPTRIDPKEKLTKKELEILTFIQKGNSNKEIANALFIEVSTVKSHINKIYSKLEVSSRSELLNN
jgi:DNA-binding CsgD family transcriptional regulator